MHIAWWGGGGGASKVGLNAVIQARRHSKSLSGDAPSRKAPRAEGKIIKKKRKMGCITWPLDVSTGVTSVETNMSFEYLIRNHDVKLGRKFSSWHLPQLLVSVVGSLNICYQVISANWVIET